jgi:LacI family transcriptional regulator
MGVIEAVQEAGLLVPDDLSVVGFDNIPEATYVNGGLTTVDQFIDQMGYIAVQMLVDLLQNKPVENDLHQVQTELVIRGTCREIAQSELPATTG